MNGNKSGGALNAARHFTSRMTDEEALTVSLLDTSEQQTRSPTSDEQQMFVDQPLTASSEQHCSHQQVSAASDTCSSSEEALELDATEPRGAENDLDLASSGSRILEQAAGVPMQEDRPVAVDVGHVTRRTVSLTRLQYNVLLEPAAASASSQPQSLTLPRASAELPITVLGEETCIVSEVECENQVNTPRPKLKRLVSLDKLRKSVRKSQQKMKKMDTDLRKKARGTIQKMRSLRSKHDSAEDTGSGVEDHTPSSSPTAFMDIPPFVIGPEYDEVHQPTHLTETETATIGVDEKENKEQQSEEEECEKTTTSRASDITAAGEMEKFSATPDRGQDSSRMTDADAVAALVSTVYPVRSGALKRLRHKSADSSCGYRVTRVISRENICTDLSESGRCSSRWGSRSSAQNLPELRLPIKSASVEQIENVPTEAMPSASSKSSELMQENEVGNRREHLYKILIIGELGTGKTSIIKRYVHQFFSDHYRATIGVDFALKVLHWDANTIVRLQLWDIAGQERFGSMTRVYYKEAVAAFIVFDVSRAATFDAVLKWKHDLDEKVQLANGEPVPCILLANKCDMQKQGMVENADSMSEWSEQNGFIGWHETSAKENLGIEQAMQQLVSCILTHERSGDLTMNGEGMDMLDLDPLPAEKSKCSC